MKATFKEEGFYIEKASDPETTAAVEDARARALELATDTGSIKNRNWTLKDGSFKHHMNPHLSEPAFRRLLNSPGITKCIRGILGSTAAYITHSKISYKFAGKNHYWHPHQDAGYKAKLRKGFAMAVYLDDCRAENGTLEFYPQSHKLGLIRHRREGNKHENLHQAVLDATINITPKFIEGECGTIVCFDLLMVHSSGENKTGGCRPIYIFEIEPFRFFPTADTGENGYVVNGEALRPFLYLGPRLVRLKKWANEKGIQLRRKWTSRTKTPVAAIDKCRPIIEAYRAGDYKATVDSIGAVIDRERSQQIKDELIFYKANSLYFLGHYQQSAELLSSLLKRRQQPELLNNMGVVLYRLRDAAAGERMLQQALDMKPDYLDAISNLEVVRRSSPDSSAPKLTKGYIRN